MDKIFENLRENVSEACFNDIVSMVEELLGEGNNLLNVVNRANNSIGSRYKLYTISHSDLEKENRLKEIFRDDNKKKELEAKASKVPDSKSYEVNKRSQGARKNLFTKHKGTNNTDTRIGNTDLTPSMIGDAASNRIQSRKAIGRHFKKEQNK